MRPLAALGALPLVLFALAVASRSAAQTPAAPADAIYTDAAVWTGKDAPLAEALAVRDGKILAVGTRADVLRHRGQNTRVEGLGGAFVAPGFVDAHVHFLNGGFQLASVDLRAARTPAAFVARVAAFVRTGGPGGTPLPEGQWITGGDWDHEAWGGELPRREWIDSVTARNPVFVNRLDGHMALANTRALEAGGVTRTVAAPEGGEIVRDARGEPTGILKDEAMGLVYAAIPAPTEAALDEAFGRAQAHAFERGVTQVHDVGSFGGWMDLGTFERAERDDRLRLRVYSLVPVSSWASMAERVREKGRGAGRLRWGGLKGFVDGSLGSTTAWFYAPYADAPETSGFTVADTTAFARDLMAADSAGLHLAVHAIGDRANDWILGTFARIAAAHGPRDRRFRVEHAQHLTDGAIQRFGALGVIPSMQPYHAIDDGRWAAKRIGDRVRTTYAFRSLLAANAPLAFGSDWTVAPLSVMEGLYAATTRRTLDGANPDGWVPAERITAEDALDAYTRAAAYAGFMDAETGTLAPGKHADFVVLSRNVLALAPGEIGAVVVLRTYVAGEEVYRRAE